MCLFQTLPSVAALDRAELQEAACRAIEAYMPWLVKTAQQIPETEGMPLLHHIRGELQFWNFLLDILCLRTFRTWIGFLHHMLQTVCALRN